MKTFPPLFNSFHSACPTTRAVTSSVTFVLTGAEWNALALSQLDENTLSPCVHPGKSGSASEKFLCVTHTRRCRPPPHPVLWHSIRLERDAINKTTLGSKDVFKKKASPPPFPSYLIVSDAFVRWPSRTGPQELEWGQRYGIHFTVGIVILLKGWG